jgi:glycosyltransferase involved in cell wall biosynthesis
MVVPSRYEGFGQTVTEAMACGTPVVAFDATGPADTIRHRSTGYLAEPYQPEDLAKGIAWILADENRRIEIGEQARDRAVEHYHYEDVASEYLSLYQELV